MIWNHNRRHPHQPSFRRVVLLIAITVAFLSGTANAQRDSKVQYSRDGSMTLVQKDFGSERWSISHRIVDGFTAGNVFFTDGSPPSFISCDRTGSSGGEMRFRCYGANECPQEPCGADQYSLISDITLPESFFFPAGELPPGFRPALSDLIGTWEVETTGSGGRGEWIFDSVVGDEVLGFDRGRNDITARLFEPAGGEFWDFVILEPIVLGEPFPNLFCWASFAVLEDPNHMRGVHRMTRRRDSGECTLVVEREIADAPFVADRVG